MHAHALCAHGILPNRDTESKEVWGQLVCRAREIEGSVVHLFLFSVTICQSIYLEVIRDDEYRHQPDGLWEVAANGVSFEGE